MSEKKIHRDIRNQKLGKVLVVRRFFEERAKNRRRGGGWIPPPGPYRVNMLYLTFQNMYTITIPPMSAFNSARRKLNANSESPGISQLILKYFHEIHFKLKLK